MRNPLLRLLGGSLTRLSLGGRISAVSAVWLVGLCIMTATVAVGYRQLSAAEIVSTAAMDLETAAERARASTAGLMAAERDFRIEPSAAGAVTLRTRITDVRHAIEEVKGKAVAIGISPETVEQLATLLRGIDTHFTTLITGQEVIGYGGGSGLSGELDATYASLRTALNKVSKSGQNPATVRIVAAFAQMNQSRAEYLLSRDDLSRGGFDVAATRMQRELGKADIPAEEKSGIGAAITAHFDAFARTAEAMTGLATAKDQIALTFDLVSPATSAVLEAARAERAEAEASLDETTSVVMFVLAVVVPSTALLGLLLSVLLGRSITRPLSHLHQTMSALARGDTVTVVGTDRSDEIGRMARAVAVFSDTAEERRRLEADASETNARRARRQAEIEAVVCRFREEVETLTAAVASTMDQMRATAGTLSNVADRSKTRAQDATRATGAASGKFSAVACSAEELASSIGEIANQVGRTTAIVADATENARRTNSKVESLSESATRVGQVVNLIQTIAEQTNLLALNATIEAARAGAAGRGFAVVAAEVKGLATQTAQATGQIAAQIAEIQASTGDAVASIQAIAATMEEVNRTTSAIAAAVEEQGAATGEISRNVQQASDETRTVAENVDGVTDAVTDTTRSAEEVEKAAEHVAARTRELQSAIDRFLGEVAAA